MTSLDTLHRPLRNLRISVTDRCNLRCDYCMPEERYTWLPKDRILSLEEIARVVDAFVELGVDRVRLTGGEPLLRHGLTSLIASLATKPRLRDLAMTTNGVLLADQAEALFASGLGRVTVSLDTLRPEIFRMLTRRDDLDRVLAGVRAAARLWPGKLKLDTVVQRGVNDEEQCELLEYAREQGAELRFIEYMDVGGATRWSMDRVVPRERMLATIAARYGEPTPLDERTSAPADRWRLPDGTVFGIIASTTAPFCAACDRSRLTADGHWFLCLYARVGVDLCGPLRDGATTAELAELIARTWSGRADRGAEERLAQATRVPLAPEELAGDPHLEMHTRGG